MKCWQPGAFLIGTILALCCTTAHSQAPTGGTPGAADPTAAVRTVLRDFDAWARVQTLYEPEQVKKFRARIVEKAGQLSGDDLAAFLADLTDRLHVLTSEEARDARRWLNQTLSVASDSYAKEIRSKLPDVAKLSAGELQEELDDFEARQTSNKQYRAGLEKTRQAQIKNIEQEKRRQEEANDRAALSDGNYSPYSPAAPRTYTPYRRPVYPVYGGWRW